MLLLIVFVLVAQPASYAAVHIINGKLQAADYVPAGADQKILEPAGEKTIYSDLPHGYSIAIPQHMAVDVSLSAIRTVFADDKTQIEIYYDNFTHTDTSAADYIYYGRKFLGNTRDHRLLQEKTVWRNGLEIHLLKWSRRPLAGLAVDRRYYATAEIIKNQREVYTIFIKSTEPIHNEQDLADSFRLIKPAGTAGIYLPSKPARPALNPETEKFLAAYFAESSPLRWGIFHPNAPDALHHLEAIEEKLDYRFPFVVRYQPLGDSVPVTALSRAYQDHRYVELTLQTYYYDKDNASVMYDILDGKYDDYFRQYAQELRDFSHPVLFRLNNEMNGDWCWYSSFHTAKDTDIYKAVWRYIHVLFKQEGVNNALWVWNPHDRSFPDFSWNHPLAYYPGDDVVDIVGMTGYNTGDYFPGESWREFQDIYVPLYREYTTVFSKPLMITEFGANSFGGNKTDWVKQMFREIGNFPKIKIAIWWSGIDRDSEGNAARIYRLDENDNIIGAFREGLKHYREN